MCADREALDELERQRAAATAAIVESTSDRKLIVAGPGTGKTFTFQEVLRARGEKGLALTFIRNLAADLEEALGDLADAFTLHGFCKHQMHRHAMEGLQEHWDYYPPLLELFAVDLVLLGNHGMSKDEIERCLHTLDDSTGVIANAIALGNYYNAVSHTDLVYRVLRHFEANTDQIPSYPQIVVDEYQDFSLLETQFIGLLASKSPTLIAGDDDQALYAFRHASARYIRELAASGEYGRFELPYCSRCTAVVVDAVNDAIAAAQRNGNLEERLAKQFVCFLPEKQEDSQAHPRIIHAKCSVERNSAPYVGKYVSQQIAAIPAEDIRESHEKRYPTVLVVGPTPFPKRVFDVIREAYPHAQLKMAQQPVIDLLDGYRRLARDERSRLGWRIVIHADLFEGCEEALAQVLQEQTELADALPDAYRDRHLETARLIQALLDGRLTAAQEATLTEGVGSSMAAIREALAIADDDDIERTPEPEPPDPNTPTIICTSLVGAKGLSAGHVFLVGFNDGHFPRRAASITDEEICCFLVALSRTRKQCHLVSCRRFGTQTLRPSTFAGWIARHLQTLTVNAAYFDNR